MFKQNVLTVLLVLLLIALNSMLCNKVLQQQLTIRDLAQLATINIVILVITLFPEICYHLLLKQEMKDTKLSNYFKWVVGIVDDEK